MDNNLPEQKTEKTNTPTQEKTTMAARLMAFLNDIRPLDKSDKYFYTPLELLTRPEKGPRECSVNDWEMLLRADKNLYLTAMNSVAKLHISYSAAIAAKNKREQQEKRQEKRQEEKLQRQEEREARRARRAEIDARIALQNDPKAMKKHRLDQHRAALQARLDHIRNEIPRREAIIAEQPTLPAGLQDPYLPVILEQVKAEAAKIEAELAALGTE